MRDKNAELLKDRRAYREALIQRQADLEQKIKRVEEEIRTLTEGKRSK